MKGESIPLAECYSCGYKMNRSADAFGDTKPKPGDASMCLCCGILMVFQNDMTLRKPTIEETEKFNKNPNILLAQFARAAVVGDEIKKEKRK